MTNPWGIQVAEVLQNLEGWQGSKLLVRKVENGDFDETSVQLSATDFMQNQPTMDGYISPYVIRLQGDGEVIMDSMTADLPMSSYEIAMGEVYNVDIDNNMIHLRTDRGDYTITKVQ
ncbi:hypothetical protein CIB95_00335 [Lottiidibacillus patelloidae]|uniref:Uncharacterized protein n=1 Tax=Lottiidibacillus patelloidae TaxID=2670334 RepID=A0A263BWD8_9BACI|nr:hypothetical protein [Lottiidibacillus patelloidae]OZM58061.1 hypothetical protein CIB95_00335 [Lottiidibacillus patelloidae]